MGKVGSRLLRRVWEGLEFYVGFRREREEGGEGENIERERINI